jgi:hypothetical protein
VHPSADREVHHRTRGDGAISNASEEPVSDDSIQIPEFISGSFDAYLASTINDLSESSAPSSHENGLRGLSTFEHKGFQALLDYEKRLHRNGLKVFETAQSHQQRPLAETEHSFLDDASQVPPDESTLQHQLNDRNSSTTNFFIDTYFDYFHPQWPFLHKPSFRRDLEPQMIISSVVMIGAWMTDDKNSRNLAMSLHDRLMRELVPLTVCLLFLVSPYFNAHGFFRPSWKQNLALNMGDGRLRRTKLSCSTLSLLYIAEYVDGIIPFSQ